MFATNRYALYYRLIDIAFVCQIAMLAASLYEALVGQSATDGWLYWPLAVIAGIGLVLPPLLIFQRWMRDDLSERLWQRTAGTVLKLLIILPLPLMFAVGISIVSGNAFDFAVEPTSHLNAERQALLRGALYPMATLWVLTPICFTFVFQWHRWRASR